MSALTTVYAEQLTRRTYNCNIGSNLRWMEINYRSCAYAMSHLCVCMDACMHARACVCICVCVNDKD